MRDILKPRKGKNNKIEPAKRIFDVTYDELRSVIDIVCSAKLSEEENGFYIDLLEINLPGSGISDLIFWPDIWFNDKSKLHIDMTSEEILDFALTLQEKMPKGFPCDKKLPELPDSKKKDPPPVINL